MVKKQKGFTLVELLVAIGILGVVGGIATIILFTTLRSASKSDIMREVKQNGDYAISVMERMVRNAQGVETVDNSSCSTTGNCGAGTCMKIKNPDGRTTNFLKENVGDVFKIASNSGTYLTSNKVTVVGDLNFTCTRTPGKPDVVSINFTLSQPGTPTRPEERASINFQTTVSLRTY